MNNKDKECTGSYDKSNDYMIDCKQVKCHGNYSVKCKDIYCPNNAKSCIHFFNLNRPSISKFRIPHRSNSHAVLAKLMKTCQSKEYKSNKKDVCLNGYKFNLVMKSIDYSRSQPKLIIKKIACLFKGKHNFHCGSQYCTINTQVCDQLLMKLKSSNRKEQLFSNKCLNDNQSILI